MRSPPAKTAIAAFAGGWRVLHKLLSKAVRGAGYPAQTFLPSTPLTRPAESTEYPPLSKRLYGGNGYPTRQRPETHQEAP
jgi:hypothetical protein